MNNTRNPQTVVPVRDYVRILKQIAGMKSLGALTGAIGTVFSVGCVIFVLGIFTNLFEAHAGLALILALGAALFGGIAVGAFALMRDILIKLEAVPDVQPANAHTAVDLPLDQLFLRGSDAPASDPQELLHVNSQQEETHREQLLRSSGNSL